MEIKSYGLAYCLIAILLFLANGKTQSQQLKASSWYYQLQAPAKFGRLNAKKLPVRSFRAFSNLVKKR